MWNRLYEYATLTLWHRHSGLCQKCIFDADSIACQCKCLPMQMQIATAVADEHLQPHIPESLPADLQVCGSVVRHFLPFISAAVYFDCPHSYRVPFLNVATKPLFSFQTIHTPISPYLITFLLRPSGSSHVSLTPIRGRTLPWWFQNWAPQWMSYRRRCGRGLSWSVRAEGAMPFCGCG